VATTVTDSFQRTGADLGANWTNKLNGFSVTPGAAKGTTPGALILNAAEYTGASFSSDYTVFGTIGSLSTEQRTSSASQPECRAPRPLATTPWWKTARH
jgi:hypothetical protein